MTATTTTYYLRPHNYLVRTRILNHLAKLARVFVYELNGCGFESRCCLSIERVQHNPETLNWVIKTIELCEKQCIAVRGYREDVVSNKNNCGDFLAILKLLAQTNEDLQKHRTSPVAKNTNNSK